MTEITYVAADFNVIRNNQFKLIQQGKIEDEKETKIQKQQQLSVEIKNTETILDLTKVWENEFFDKKNQGFIKISFLKSAFGNKYMAILGAQGEQGSSVKLYENKKLLGVYKVLLSLPDKASSINFANQINKYKTVDNKKEWELYTFVKKL
jgi:hypothetical protein